LDKKATFATYIDEISYLGLDIPDLNHPRFFVITIGIHFARYALLVLFKKNTAAF
jgi:hypothetical protein